MNRGESVKSWLNDARRAGVSWLKAGARRVPLFGRLREVPREGLQQAFYETATTILFATMPFWILPVLGAFMFTPKPGFDEAFKNGEGLVYAAVLLGPLFYVLTKRYGNWTLRREGKRVNTNRLTVSFPYGTAFVAITAFTCVISGFTFSLIKRGINTPDVNRAGIQSLSWMLVIFSTVMFFLITSYRNMLDDLANNKADTIIEEQPRGETAFLDSWLGAK